MASRIKMRRRRRTKIIATLGPASSTPEVLSRLFHAGADVFRLNFSHGSHEDHFARIQMIRALEEHSGRPIGILADVQGPKLRVGRFQAGRVVLQTGQTFRLDMSSVPGDTRRVALPHPEIIGAAGIGTSLLLDDGKLRLRVVHVREDHLETEVVTGGPLSDRKGVNVPDVALPIPALTEKDRADLDFALQHGVDFIGLSFVQRAEDVAEAKTIANGRAWIMTKIEKPQALENLDAILAESDAVMVARGDLGVELPPEEVPLAQKRIVRAAWQRGIPVVVATQMLESMISAPAPTRAEASDVATAVFDGADAVMLSAETAAGQYPYEAGEHDGPDRGAGGAGPGLAQHDRGWAAGAGAGVDERDCDGEPADCAHDRGGGDCGIHRGGEHGAADCAGAAGCAGAGADEQSGDGPADGGGLGGACGDDGGGALDDGGGEPGGAAGADGGVRGAWG